MLCKLTLNPVVSVCITTYNHEKYVARAIESVLSQKALFQYEVIIHDDASTDNTQKIIKEYAEKYPDKIRTILQTENQHSLGRETFQIVMKEAVGDYIALLEGDDFWCNDYKLFKQVEYMEAHPECSICTHGAMTCDGEEKYLKRIVRPMTESGILPMERIIREGGLFATASMLFRREQLWIHQNIPVPEFCKKMKTGDYPLTLYLASQGYVYYIDEYMSVYRINIKSAWTYRTAHSRSRQLEYARWRVDMLACYNEFTEGRFTEIIEKFIDEKLFGIYILTDNYKGMTSPQHIQKFKSLPKITRAKLTVWGKMPGLHSLFLKLRGME